jgi:hypothetical protein
MRAGAVRRNDVRPGQHGGGEIGDRHAVGAHIAALVGEDLVLEPEDEAARIDRRAQPVDLIARLVRRHQVLVAVLDPLHRALELQRGMAHEDVLGVELAAHAEAAADMALDEVHHVARPVEHARHLVAVVMRHLRRAAHREHPACLVELGERAARLERHRAVAADSHLEVDN